MFIFFSFFNYNSDYFAEQYRRAGPPTTSLASRIANMIAHQVANGANTSTAASGQLRD